MRGSILITLFVSILFSVTSIAARDVTFLPAYVIGDAPENLRAKESNIGEGISDLLGYYAHENYMVDLSDSDKLRNYLDSIDNTNPDRKPSRELINGICEEMETDYISKSEIDFSGTPVIQTHIYNCKGRLLYSEESILNGNFYNGLEKHAKKTFAFLTPRRKQDITQYAVAEEEIVFALDLSGSISKDTKDLANYLDSITGTNGLSLGLVLLSEKGVKVIKPDTNHSRFRAELSRLRFGSNINMEILSSYLQKAKKELFSAKSKKRKLVLFTDAKSEGSNSYKFISALQSYGQQGFTIHLVTGSFFDFKEMGIYRKASSSTGIFYQIRHSQRIGTIQGFRTVYLYDRKIFYDINGRENIADVNLKELPQIPEGKVYGLVSFPHPGNFSKVYLDYSKDKLLESSPVNSNISSIAEKIIFSGSKSYSKLARKVLIKTSTSSFWVYFSEFSDDLLNQDIGIRATFKKDPTSALGFSNIPEETSVYKDNVPLLLNLSPIEIKDSLYKGDKDFINCFIKGRVLEVK